jgi:predicted DNA-binding antitoxin AbrB/MazE fold protein
MTIQVDATYDGGVLKPHEPLKLPDQLEVTLIVRPKASAEMSPKIEAQRAALKALWTELDQMPQPKDDGHWSVRQHDDLLYGEP